MIKDGINICDKCGHENELYSKTCRICGEKLKKEVFDGNDAEILEEISSAEWQTFIDRNVFYYINKFRKSKGKKIFASFNWSAFFFGPFWIFYRKMYYIGILLILTNLLCSAIGTVSVYGIYKDEIKSANNAIDIHLEYVDSALSEEIDFRTNYDAEEYYSAKNFLYKIDRKITIVTSTIEILFSLGLGIFANALYKSHVKKKLATSNGYYAKGGVSVGSIFLCLAIEICLSIFFSVATEIIVTWFITH